MPGPPGGQGKRLGPIKWEQWEFLRRAPRGPSTPCCPRAPLGSPCRPPNPLPCPKIQGALNGTFFPKQRGPAPATKAQVQRRPGTATPEQEDAPEQDQGVPVITDIFYRTALHADGPGSVFLAPATSPAGARQVLPGDVADIYARCAVNLSHPGQRLDDSP